MDDKQGFDGREVVFAFQYFDPTLTVTPPVDATPSVSGTQTLMKAVSENQPSSTCNASATGRVCLEYVEALTILQAPPGDTFRPAWFGTSKTLIPASDFDDSFLSNLTPVPSTGTWAEAEAWALSLKPQHYVSNGNRRQGYHARVNNQLRPGVQGYEASAQLVATRALIKLTEVARGADAISKRKVAKGIAQLGIDLFAIHSEDESINGITGSRPCGAWVAHGGFGGGRLVPLLFANKLLGKKWHTTINTNMSTLNGRNCFQETGLIQPESVTSVGKGVPLFGHARGNRGLIAYFDGFKNCNVVNANYLTDGNGDQCGCPTAYQSCCTHGQWMGDSMALWLTPAVLSIYPSNGKHWLTYMNRVRTAGVALGTHRFGAYCNPSNFDVTGYNTHYANEAAFELWNTYAACSMKPGGTRNCAGLGSP